MACKSTLIYSLYLIHDLCFFIDLIFDLHRFVLFVFDFGKPQFWIAKIIYSLNTNNLPVSKKVVWPHTDTRRIRQAFDGFNGEQQSRPEVWDSLWDTVLR